MTTGITHGVYRPGFDHVAMAGWPHCKKVFEYKLQEGIVPPLPFLIQ
jgi:hypothetical protein